MTSTKYDFKYIFFGLKASLGSEHVKEDLDKTEKVVTFMLQQALVKPRPSLSAPLLSVVV